MSYTTIFKAYPGGTSGTTPGNLYAELKRPEEGTSKAALSFQRISGSYINSTMSIKRVTFEFRAAFSGSNEGTFTFQNSNGTVVAEVKDIDNNTGKNLYYRADYGSYPNDKNIFPPWEGAIDSALSSLLANDFTLYFCCLDALYNTVAVQIWKYNSAASGFNTNEWTCTVEWEYKTQLPTPPTKIGTSASPQGTTTAFTGVDKIRLYWSGATGGVNASGSVSVTKYSISGGNISGSADTTNNYYDFNFHATLNTTYTYTIKTISPAGTSSPLTITLKTVYTEPGTPTNVKVGGVTQVYIGKTSPPSSFQLTWSAPSAGTNNTIVKYEIYKGSTLLTTTTSTSYSITSTNYPASNNSSVVFKIKAKGKYGSGSALSSGATITAIAAPSNPSVSKTEIYSKDNPTLQWASVPLETSTQSSLNYVVSSGSTQLYKGTNLSYYYPTTIADGTSINFVIKTVVTAKHGGTVSSSGVTIKYTKMGIFSFPSDFWQGIQEGSTKPTVKKGYVYQNVSVSWKEPDSTRSPFTYQLQFRPSSNSNWQTVTLASNVDTFKLGFNIVSGGAAEGNVIGFQVIATDKYGISNTSGILTATKIKRPIISKLSASNITSENFQANFSIQGQATNESITYSIALKYENNLTESLIGNQNINIDPTSNHSFNLREIDISLKGKNTSTNTCWKNLYTKVITNKYSQPIVSFVVKASYDNFKDCVAEAECSFQANYRNTPSTLATFTINTSNSNNFYNPGDTFSTSLNAFTWTDAAEGTSGATITHKIISNYTNKSYNIGSTITVPEVLKDTTVTFKTQTTIQYADGQEVFYNEASSLPKINIARWVADSIYIKNFTKITGGFEGILYIPNTLCSSTTYRNLSSLALSANFNGTTIDSDSTPSIIFEYLKGTSTTWEKIENQNISGETLYDQNASKDRIRFKINKSDLTSCNFSIKTQWKNTSNKVLTIETPIFSYVAAAADFSIRKGRVGINVGEDFVGGSGSTLQVNAASYNNIGPIIEVISTNSSTTNTKTTFLELKDNSLVSKIYSNGTNLYIDNLKVTGYLPLTGGTLTGNFVLRNGADDALIYFNPTNSSAAGGIVIYNKPTSSNTDNSRIFFRQYSYSSSDPNTRTSYYENYYLPRTASGLTANSSYNILTSKNEVTVAQGGTGRTTLTSGYALIGNGTNAVSLRAITNNTETGGLGWTKTLGTNLVTLNTLAYFDGSYNGTTSNITKLGTISKGIWNGSAIPVAHGGTGATDPDTALTNLGGRKVYRSVEALGLTAPVTTYAAYAAMPSHSTLIVQSAEKKQISDTPMSHGTVIIHKAHTYGYAECTNVNSASLVFYMTNLYPDRAFDGWKQVITQDGGTLTGTLTGTRAHFTATADASETSNANVALRLGTATGQHIDIDVNEILSKTNATTMGELYLQGMKISNGGVIGTGTWKATKIGIAYGGTNATKRGADTNGALYNLGIFYATDLDSIGVTPQKGDICLIPV